MGGRVQHQLPPTLRTRGPFRLLFAGQALSVVGDRITPIAIAFAVLGLGNATDLGLVLAASGVPFALFAVAGGVVSDRVGRRRVMIASDVVRTLSQATVAVLLLTGSAEVWMLVVLSAVYGTAAAAFMPALIGLIPQTVPPDRLQEANALLGFTRSIASVAGPALAGILIAIGGPGDAIAVDAVTFALSAACLIALRPDPAAAARRRRGGRRLRRAAARRAGGRCAGARGSRPASAPWRAYHVFVLPAVWILGPALAASDLGGASSWAIIVACFGLGTIAGNLLALRLSIRRPVLVAAVALVGAATQAVIIGSGLGTAGIAMLEFPAGIAVSLFFTLWDTSIQEQVPPAAVSRVSSYDFAVSLGLMPLGMAVAGPIAAAAGLQTTLIAMSAVGDGRRARVARGPRRPPRPPARRARADAAAGARAHGARPRDAERGHRRPALRAHRAERRALAPGVGLAVGAPRAVERDGPVDPAQRPPPGRRPPVPVPRGVADLARGQHAPGPRDRRDPAREVHRPPVPVSRARDGRAGRDADPQLRERVALGRGGVVEAQRDIEERVDVRRHEHGRVADRLDEPHGRLGQVARERGEALGDRRRARPAEPPRRAA